MNVWLVTTGDTLGDPNGTRKLRTGRLAERLTQQGHQVLWWMSAFEHQRRQMLESRDVRRRLGPNLDAQFLHGGGYRRNVSIARYVDHRIIAWKFKRMARRERPPDVVVASLPCHNLACEVVRYAKAAGVPVVVDVRDLWPDIFVTTAPRGARAALRLLLTQDFTRCRAALSSADAIVAVSDGYLRWGLGKAGRERRPSRDRVFYLGAEPPGATGNRVPEWLRSSLSSRIVAYVGTFGRSYELDLVLDAAAWALRTGRGDVRFVIAGTGDQQEKITERARDLPNVVLPGWIGPDEIDNLLAHAYVGLAPYRAAENTVPNKPFEYFSAGVPIISSLEGEMAGLVTEHDLGLNYKPGDLDGLCAAIARALDDERGRNEQSVHARAFFERHGNAERIDGEYARHVIEIAGGSIANEGFVLSA